MFFISILIIELLAGIETSIVVPTFPQLIAEFGLTTFDVELTLGVNMFALCLAAVFIGNLSNIFSRKYLLFYGTMLFIGSTVVCMCAGAFWQLLLGRFLQGIGVSAACVIPYTIISDSYDVSEQPAVFGKINAGLTLMIAASPIIGSMITMKYGWRANFVLLLIVAIITAILSIVMIPHNKKDVKVNTSVIKSMFLPQDYLSIVKNVVSMRYIFVICFLMITYWVFLGMSSVLYVRDMHVTLKEFALHQGSLTLTFAMLSFSSGFFINKFGQRRCLQVAGIILGTFAVAVLCAVIMKVSTPIYVTLIMQLLSFGSTFPISILYPRVLNSMPRHKEKIVAFIVAFRQILAAVILQIAGYFHEGTFTSIGISMIATLLIMGYFASSIVRAQSESRS